MMPKVLLKYLPVVNDKNINFKLNLEIAVEDKKLQRIENEF